MLNCEFYLPQNSESLRIQDVNVFTFCANNKTTNGTFISGALCQYIHASDNGLKHKILDFFSAKL